MARTVISTGTGPKGGYTDLICQYLGEHAYSYVFDAAERMGGDEDRIYTIVYAVTDDCGNVTMATATVNVPHDMGD